MAVVAMTIAFCIFRNLQSLKTGGNHVKAGLYGCNFDGNGTLAFEVDAVAIGEVVWVEGGGGRYLVNITPASGVTVRLLSTDSSDPLRNIRLVPQVSARNFSPDCSLKRPSRVPTGLWNN
eukprot:8743190-Pyramimonas_sp.AAC.1